MSDRFKGKSIAITGASSGLGAALAMEFARRGARLTLFSPQAQEQEQVAADCRALGADATAVVGDVTQPEDCKRLSVECVAEYGALDYLIANAGISMWTSFEDVEDIGIFRKLIDINYLGAVNCMYYALPYLKQMKGMIVAITSIQAKIPVPQHTGYVASKHALQGFCDSLRMELKESGVDILTVLPHWLTGTDLRERAVGKDGGELGESSRKHSKDAISVDDACLMIAKAMAKRQRELIIPPKLKALLGLRLFNAAAAEALIEKAMTKQKKT
jgi:short-subunit dehydrogenase